MGVFSFIVPAGNKYRISLGSGIKTASKTVDTATLKDVDVGDMVFEYCPPGRNFAIPKAPANAPMIGSLSLDQIAIEPQHSNSFLSIGAPEPPPYKYVEPPPCWSGLVSADHRADWEGVGVYQLRFDQYVSIEGFVGSKVKSILVMDEWIHVQVQDRAGHYWYIRLWPAVD